MPIVLRVREIREALGWSQDYLADVSGVTQKTISRIERGVGKSIDFDVLERLARALRVDPAVLFVQQGP